MMRITYKEAAHRQSDGAGDGALWSPNMLKFP